MNAPDSRALGRYGLASFAVVIMVGAVGWPLLDNAGRRSLATAAVLVWPLQMGQFVLLHRSLGDPTRFLVWWGMGFLGRMAVVAVAGLGLSQLDGMEPSVLVLATAGLFFVLLLMEPVFFTRRETRRFAR